MAIQIGDISLPNITPTSSGGSLPTQGGSPPVNPTPPRDPISQEERDRRRRSRQQNQPDPEAGKFGPQIALGQALQGPAQDALRPLFDFVANTFFDQARTNRVSQQQDASVASLSSLYGGRVPDRPRSFTGAGPSDFSLDTLKRSQPPGTAQTAFQIQNQAFWDQFAADRDMETSFIMPGQGDLTVEEQVFLNPMDSFTVESQVPGLHERTRAASTQAMRRNQTIDRLLTEPAALSTTNPEPGTWAGSGGFQAMVDEWNSQTNLPISGGPTSFSPLAQDFEEVFGPEFSSPDFSSGGGIGFSGFGGGGFGGGGGGRRAAGPRRWNWGAVLWRI